MEDDTAASGSAGVEVTEAGPAAVPAEDRLGDVQPVQAAVGKRRSRPFYVKRYGAGTLLLALFIIMLACAFLVYPRRSAVYRPGSPYLHIYTSGTVQSLDASLRLAVSRSGAVYGSDLSVGMEVSMPANIVTRPVSVIDIPLPAGLTPEGCGRALGGVCTFRSGLLTAKAIFLPGRPSGGRLWFGSTDILLVGRLLPWASNGLEVEGQLPVISIRSLSELPGFKRQAWAPSNPRVTIDYYVPDPTSYDWVGGPEPSVFRSHPCRTCQGGSYPGYVEWAEPLGMLSAPVAVSGANKSAAQWDSFRTLAAGTLMGIAGGALVGAIQEATQRKDKAGRAPDRPRPDPETGL